MKWPRFAVILGAICFASGLFPAFSGAQDKTLAEIYKTGKIRFIPEITITDETLGGKDFFAGATDIAINGKGAVYVCDSRGNNIKKFDSRGKYLKTIGKQGQGPGDFNYPIEMEIAGNRLYVRELMNSRISILDPEGLYLKSVSLADRSRGSWQKMRSLPDGRFIVEKEIVNRADLNAAQECVIELYSSDFMSIKTIYQHQVRRNKYINEPRRTNVPIPFSPQVHWDVIPDGKIAIGFSEKYSIDIYDPDKGKLSAFSHSSDPVEVKAKDKDEFFNGIMSSSVSTSGAITGTRGAPDFIVKNTEFPKYYPPYNDLKVDSEGNIWIRQYFARASETSQNFDVFDRDGKFINRVQIEGEAHYPGRTAWTSRGFWTVTMTGDEEYKIVKYKISG